MKKFLACTILCTQAVFASEKAPMMPGETFDGHVTRRAIDCDNGYGRVQIGKLIKSSVRITTKPEPTKEGSDFKDHKPVRCVKVTGNNNTVAGRDAIHTTSNASCSSGNVTTQTVVTYDDGPDVKTQHKQTTLSVKSHASKGEVVSDGDTSYKVDADKGVVETRETISSDRDGKRYYTQTVVRKAVISTAHSTEPDSESSSSDDDSSSSSSDSDSDFSDSNVSRGKEEYKQKYKGDGRVQVGKVVKSHIKFAQGRLKGRKTTTQTVT